MKSLTGLFGIALVMEACSPSPPHLTPTEWFAGGYEQHQGKTVWLGGFLHEAGPILMDTMQGSDILGLRGTYLLWILDGHDTVWAFVLKGPIPQNLEPGMGVWVRGKGDGEILVVEQGTDIVPHPATHYTGEVLSPQALRKRLPPPEK